MLNVVRRVTNIANMIIVTGRATNVHQPNAFNPSIASNPTRAECAVDNINSNTGMAAIKPNVAASVVILATIICIWRATKLSDAPIWVKISNSRRCNIAVLRAIYDIDTPIAPNANARTRTDIPIIFQPADVDVLRADACDKNRAFFSIDFWMLVMSSDDLNSISHIVGK